MTPLEKYRLALTEFRVWKAKEFPPGTVVFVGLDKTQARVSSEITHYDYDYNYPIKVLPDEIIVRFNGDSTDTLIDLSVIIHV